MGEALRELLLCHMIAFAAGFLLDLCLGDPYWMPHPIRMIGRQISFWEKSFLGSKENPKPLTEEKQRLFGTLLVVLLLGSTLVWSVGLLLGAYLISRKLGVVVETCMTYQILATKCLKVESMKVYHALKEKGLEAGRSAVAMIVGRDTACLDETGVAKAAIETVAENTSDGVIAPMIYTALGGPVLGFLYKTVNTMDSMVGYKNDRYLHFGRRAARLDDVVNFLPARLSAYLMLAACLFLGGEYSAKEGSRIYHRDRRKHASPNSAHTESVCAGALGIQLAGNAYYFGKLHEKPTIGDANRPVEFEDIVRANRLLYAAAALGEGACLFGMVILLGLL